MYAVLETGSKQYRVSAGDTLEIELLAVEAGQPVTFDRVLLVNNDGKLAVGSPTVAGATVVSAPKMAASCFSRPAICSLRFAA